MADGVDINSSEELEAWLEDKPVDWARALAARAALRVFPVVLSAADLPDDVLLEQQRQNLILQAFRAVFISMVGCKYSEPFSMGSGRFKTVAAAAAETARTAVETAMTAGAAAGAVRAAAAAAATIEHSAEHYEYFRMQYTGPSVASARRAASAAGSAVAYAALWGQTNEDAQVLENDKSVDSRLIEMPLWIAGRSQRALSDSNAFARNAYDKFVNLEWVRGSSWELITDWYAAILPNGRGRRPKSLFGEKADIAVALQPDEFWTVTDERSAERILDEIEEIASRSRDVSHGSTIPEFILEFLESRKQEATIDEVRQAFSDADYRVIDKTLRGELSRLAKEGRIIRLRRGVYCHPNWHTTDNPLDAEEIARDVNQALQNSEPQAPAPFRFAWQDDKIVAEPPLSETRDADTAQDLLDEARSKAESAVSRFQYSNADPRIKDSISNLQAVLPERLSDLRPGLLRSRSRSIEADALAFGNQDEEQELFAGAVALLVDLSETLRDLQGCFPQLRDIEAEIFALDLDPAKADQAKSHLDEIVDAVSEYETIVDQSAIYALHTMEGIASEEAPAAVKQKRIAEYALVVRNFISPVARFALDNAFSRGVKKDAAEIWRKARPKFVDGAADGLGSMGRPVAIITVAALVHLIFGPVAGVATAAAGFGKVDRLLKLADKWLEKAEAGDNARSADDELTEEADVDN